MRLRHAIAFLGAVAVAAALSFSPVDAGIGNCGVRGKCPGPSPTITPSPTATITPTPSPTPTPTVAPTPSPTANGYTFADEFDGTLSRWSTTSHWSQLGDAIITTANNSVANGVLTMTARNTTGSWVGAGLDTYGRWTQLYGLWEARIKIPKGYGLWPGFWNAVGNYGPEPEIDAMEICANPIGTRSGNDASLAHNTVHFAGGGQTSHDTRTVDLSLAYHVYAMDWRAGHVTFFIDGAAIWTYTGSNTPSVAMPVILDLAVGGGWCGAADGTTPNPAAMLVDWVHIRA